jgi:adenine C2-methylase RlmN of 23S rRNA A2503 and tRNA A37
MIPTLRTLTRKSKLGFGKNKDLTVQRLLDLKKNLSLISAYYRLTSINFTEDILTELKITEDYRIEKPSLDIDAYYKFLNENGFEKKVRSREGSDIRQKETTIRSRGYLQSKNHGR